MPSHRSDIGEFLRSRRGRIQPADTGLQVYGERRRVPGLRREELAQLAGVSADYYVRLEQGRLENVSAEILDAVARVLRLTDAERRHLHELAGRTRNRRTRVGQAVRPSQQWVLDSLRGAAGWVVGTAADLLAWNHLACQLLGVDLDALPPAERNMARVVFLEDAVRARLRPWEPWARYTVGALRMHAGRHPDDARMAALVEELTVRSPEFGKWWLDHPVWAEPHGRQGFWHPEAGEFTLSFEAFVLPDMPDSSLVVLTAAPGSPGRAALDALARRDDPR